MRDNHLLPTGRFRSKMGQIDDLLIGQQRACLQSADQSSNPPVFIYKRLKIDVSKGEKDTC